VGPYIPMPVSQVYLDQWVATSTPNSLMKSPCFKWRRLFDDLNYLSLYRQANGVLEGPRSGPHGLGRGRGRASHHSAGQMAMNRGSNWWSGCKHGPPRHAPGQLTLNHPRSPVPLKAMDTCMFSLRPRRRMIKGEILIRSGIHQ
jgi:hypothetical protein